MTVVCLDGPVCGPAADSVEPCETETHSEDRGFWESSVRGVVNAVVDSGLAGYRSLVKEKPAMLSSH